MRDQQRERLRHLVSSAILHLWKKETGSQASVMIEGTVCITSGTGKTTVLQVSEHFVGSIPDVNERQASFPDIYPDPATVKSHSHYRGTRFDQPQPRKITNHLIEQLMKKEEEYEDEEDGACDDGSVNSEESQLHDGDLKKMSEVGAICPGTGYYTQFPKSEPDLNNNEEEDCDRNEATDLSDSRHVEKPDSALMMLDAHNKVRNAHHHRLLTSEQEAFVNRTAAHFMSPGTPLLLSSVLHPHPIVSPSMISPSGAFINPSLPFTDDNHASAEVTIKPEVQSEPKVYKCEYCAKTFLFKSKYHEHLPVHTNARPFHCHICARTYKYKYDLRVHLRTHMGIPTKSTICPFCSEKFDTNKLLRSHIKDAHRDKQKISEQECTQPLDNLPPAL